MSGIMAMLPTLLLGALALVMFGVGLSLRVADFTRLREQPRAVAIALGLQVVALPLACWGLVEAFGLPPPLAVGMMLLAASPGGVSANLFSHLFGGDVALNISLTAANTLLAIVTLPLVANLALMHFMDGDAAVGLQTRKLAEDWKKILLNLREVRIMDSSGIGEVVSSWKLAKRFGASVKLLRPGPHIQRTLRLTQILPLLEVYDDEAEAVASFVTN